MWLPLQDRQTERDDTHCKTDRQRETTPFSQPSPASWYKQKMDVAWFHERLPLHLPVYNNIISINQRTKPNWTHNCQNGRKLTITTIHEAVNFTAVMTCYPANVNVNVDLYSASSQKMMPLNACTCALFCRQTNGLKLPVDNSKCMLHTTVSVRFLKNSQFRSEWIWFRSVLKMRFGLDIAIIYYLCNSWVVNLQQILNLCCKWRHSQQQQQVSKVTAF